MVEAAVEVDDALMERYLGGEELSEEEIRAALRKGTLNMDFFPVACGSAFKNKGVQPLLDAVVHYLPSPLDLEDTAGTDPSDEEKVVTRKASVDEPLAALAFKIVTDPYVGVLTFVRVYSGKLESGSTVLNPTTGRRERIGRLVKMHANNRGRCKVYRSW